jgi:anti-anti-sigma factor
MKFRTEEVDGILVIYLSGSIRAEDNRSLENLVYDLEVEEYRGVVIDFAPLEYVNSRAIGTVMALWKQAAAEGVPVAVTEPNPLVARLLRAVGLYGLLHTFPDVDSARNSLLE